MNTWTIKITPDRGIINNRKLYDLRIMPISKWCILCKRIIRGYTFFTPNLYCSYHIALLGFRDLNVFYSPCVLRKPSLWFTHTRSDTKIIVKLIIKDKRILKSFLWTKKLGFVLLPFHILVSSHLFTTVFHFSMSSLFLHETQHFLCYGILQFSKKILIFRFSIKH